MVYNLVFLLAFIFKHYHVAVFFVLFLKNTLTNMTERVNVPLRFAMFMQAYSQFAPFYPSDWVPLGSLQASRHS